MMQGEEEELQQQQLERKIAVAVVDVEQVVANVVAAVVVAVVVKMQHQGCWS